jgi:hypothetical protein
VLACSNTGAFTNMESKYPSSGAARAVAIASVIVMMVVALWRAFGGPDNLFVVLMIASALLIVVEYRNIAVKLRNTALVLFIASLVLLPFAKSPMAAVQRGIFVSSLLVALLASVMLLARCGLRSPHVHAVGTNLRGLRPGRRYLSFTVVSQLFSAMLGMAGVNIMLVMAAPPGEAKSESRTATVIAVTRGFSAAGFWSPVYGNMAILLALYPTLHWIEVFPMGVALAQITVFVGMLMNHSGRKAMPEVVVDTPAQQGMAAAAIPVFAVMLGFLGLVLAASGLLKIGITASIVLLGPIAALVLSIAMGKSGRRVVEGLRGMCEGALQFPRLASEAILFTAAGCAGSIMADAFPAEWVRLVGGLLDGFPLLGVGFLMLVIMGISLVGIHPVLTSVFMATAFTPQVLALPPIVHIAAILTGWGLTASLTPFSVLTLTASRYAGTGLYQISIGRNWGFALVSAGIACGLLTVVAVVMG